MSGIFFAPQKQARSLGDIFFSPQKASKSLGDPWSPGATYGSACLRSCSADFPNSVDGQVSCANTRCKGDEWTAKSSSGFVRITAGVPFLKNMTTGTQTAMPTPRPLPISFGPSGAPPSSPKPDDIAPTVTPKPDDIAPTIDPKTGQPVAVATQDSWAKRNEYLLAGLGVAALIAAALFVRSRS